MDTEARVEDDPEAGLHVVFGFVEAVCDLAEPLSVYGFELEP